MRSLFTQQEMGERRGNWMTFIQEFDPEIKPEKIVKGQGFYKLAIDSQDLLGPYYSRWDNELTLWCSEILYIPPSNDSWYSNLFYFFHHGTCLEHLNPKEIRALQLKSSQYCLINFAVLWNNYYGVFLRCLEKEEAEKVLKYLHNGPTGGHFVGETMAHKILREGYYWPTLFRYSRMHLRMWNFCHLISSKEKKNSIPL